MARFLSGIQPSGLPHFGNYFGAMALHIARAQEVGQEAFYFIADLHALTTIQDASKLREFTREVAVSYLALGLDVERAVFWRQSDVPEVTEIAWLLATVFGVGHLERAHSYKDKVARGLDANVGLFYYPILMAADILAYDPDFVPVGQDQLQHVEMTLDMAGAYNAIYGEVFKKPKWQFSETPKIPGIDGQKMSKSYGNSVWIFEEEKAMKKLIGRIPTDSQAPEVPKEATGIIFDWIRFALPKDECDDLIARAQRGGPTGPGYGEMKARILEALQKRFASARAERARLLAHPEEIERVLQRGAERARVQARAVRDRAYRAAGLR